MFPDLTEGDRKEKQINTQSQTKFIAWIHFYYYYQFSKMASPSEKEPEGSLLFRISFLRSDGPSKNTAIPQEGVQQAYGSSPSVCFGFGNPQTLMQGRAGQGSAVQA